MLHPIDYFKFVQNAQKNRCLMARIGLNVLYDPDAFPVDLSELDKLTGVNHTVVAGFLNWAAGARDEKYRWCEDEAGDLIAMAGKRTKELSDLE